MVEYVSELPTAFVGSPEIILDFETKSGSPNLDSTNPWRNCSILSFGVTAKGSSQVYCCDSRYTKDFYPKAVQYIQDVLWYAKTWINHNIKYDAHVAMNAGIQLPDWLDLRCTMTQSKIIDSDRGAARGGYGLDALSAGWLQHDIKPYEERLQPYLGRNNKDYGNIPYDILGEYGCQDIFTTEALDNYIINRMPDRCKDVARTEIELTKILVEMERNGMRFDPIKMMVAQYHALNRMNELDAELTAITGESFRPAVSEDCERILCGKYGLPVIAYTKKDGEETENASFDKAALAAYSSLPYAPHNVIDRIIEYRKLSQRNNLFFTPLQRDWPDGILHPNYNQIVRTGRMSCSDPNAQQFDKFITGLIEPPPGWSIISTDASQIEKRLVIHYINNPEAVKAYQENPDTDFYSKLAERAGISRSAAKTVDLGTGYGEGEKKLIGQIKTNKDVQAAVKAQVEAMNLSNNAEKVQMFEMLATNLAKRIHKDYHAALPELRITAKEAEAACKGRNLGTANDSNHCYGYITNAYGRDRHLPYARRRTDFKTKDPWDRAWLAFPTLNQSTAADLMKERFVAVRKAIGKSPILPIGTIHDALIFIAPTEIARDPRTCRDIVAILESPAVDLRVPIRWAIGVSETSLKDAATSVKDGGICKTLQYNKSEVKNLEWLND